MTTTLILSGIVATFSFLAVVIAVWLMKRAAAPLPPEAKRPTVSDYEATERAAMPDEIANGTLVISEKTLHREGSRPLAAKTDQVFRTPWGLLVPVETKTRKRVYAADIVQLSCQAVALKTLGVVADYGYVRLATPGRRPNYQKVRLMTEAEIDRLWDRYQALRLKKVQPIARPAPQRCSRCAFRRGCKSATP